MLPKLLVEVPSLPKEQFVECIASLLQKSGEHATLALITARDVIVNRPGNRPEAMKAILEMAVSQNTELR